MVIVTIVLVMVIFVVVLVIMVMVVMVMMVVVMVRNITDIGSCLPGASLSILATAIEMQTLDLNGTCPTSFAFQAPGPQIVVLFGETAAPLGGWLAAMDSQCCL